MNWLHSETSSPVVDSPLFPIMQVCLQKERKERYQTFRELRNDLENLLKRTTGEKIKPPNRVELESWEWSNKVASLSNLRRFDEAMQCVDKALKINSEFAPAWYNKGLTLDKLGHFDEAIKCFSKTIEISPKNAEAWYNKAYVEDNCGQSEKAAKSYWKFFELSSSQTDYLIDYALKRIRELEKAPKST